MQMYDINDLFPGSLYYPHIGQPVQPIQAASLFLYTLKTSKNLIFWCFQGVYKETTEDMKWFKLTKWYVEAIIKYFTWKIDTYKNFMVPVPLPLSCGKKGVEAIVLPFHLLSAIAYLPREYVFYTYAHARIFLFISKFITEQTYMLRKNKSNLVLIIPYLEKKQRGSNGAIKGFWKMKIMLPVLGSTILLHYLVQISEK